MEKEIPSDFVEHLDVALPEDIFLLICFFACFGLRVSTVSLN